MDGSTSGNAVHRTAKRGPGGNRGGAGRLRDGEQGALIVPTIDIYARLSFAANGETVNVEDQIEMGTEDILSRGGRVGEVFTDNSKSAWNPKVVRKNWLKLMERLEGRTSDGVWVYNLDRFSRKVMEGERLLEAAQSGLHVWALSGEYDLRTADGRDSFRSAIQSGARESDRNSERTRRGKFRAVREGLPERWR